MAKPRNNYIFEEVRQMQYTSKQEPESDRVPVNSNGPARPQLPINLILLIISHLNDVATIASVTRASRLLYYLTIPRLYESITLRAHSSIRYVDDKPEGFGGGSPFAMGLDGLISSPNNVAQYVKDMTLCGEWKETDTGDFDKGRVPDNTMMLNIVVKAAISRAGRLERFAWSLNTKPMKTVYQGLALRDTLTHLRLRFPSSRVPRPTVMIPAMPRLKSLHISNLDPLCYNDDISLLISEARNVEALNIHWSPRMRNSREPSVYLQNYFGRLAVASHQLKPTELQFFNMFARNDGSLTKCVSLERIESLAFLNCMEYDDPSTIFVDDSWMRENPEAGLRRLKRLRAELVDSRFAKSLIQMQNLEELYLINGRYFRDYVEKRQQNGRGCSSPNSVAGTPPSNIAKTPLAETPRITIADLPEGAPNAGTMTVTTMDWQASALSPISVDSPGPMNPVNMQKHINIASDMIAAITCTRGHKWRKLLLRESWNLGREVLNHLISSCPNLEQLGIAVDEPSPATIRYIAGSLPKLRALRILVPLGSDFVRTMDANSEIHHNMLELETWRDEYKEIVWLGIGGQITKLLGRAKVDCNGQERFRGLVKAVGWEDVKDVEIFGLDTLEE